MFNSRVVWAHKALKMPEPYAVKVARTVLWGHTLPGWCIAKTI